MKNINTIMSVIVGIVASVYDLWMVYTGQLPAITLLALVGWMALLLAVCAKSSRKPGSGHAPRPLTVVA
ncbi:MAG: hypothetical protein QNJ40_13620 [Xanthomonadales bacterium]|nr:hypothetical protein [Xanthomonadales bacterium]